MKKIGRNLRTRKDVQAQLADAKAQLLNVQMQRGSLKLNYSSHFSASSSLRRHRAVAQSFRAGSKFSGTL
jgi:hypothetical protein